MAAEFGSRMCFFLGESVKEMALGTDKDFWCNIIYGPLILADSENDHRNQRGRTIKSFASHQTGVSRGPNII